MDFHSIYLLTPEILISVVALGLLCWEAFAPRGRRRFIYVGMLALFAALPFILSVFMGNGFLGAGHLGLQTVSGETTGRIQYFPIMDMISVDSLSMFFKLGILFAGILVLWLSVDHYEFKDIPMGTYVSLILFSLVGMMILVGATDFLIAVIALELVSIPTFILTGFVVNRRSSGEGALKFFLVGTFSTALLLFGISYYYGYFGTTSFGAIYEFAQSGQSPDMVISLILILLVSGIGFKLAMVPFHMWAPDAYEAAPTPVTALLSVAPKAAAIGFILRVFANHHQLNLTPVLAVLAAVTMTVGNIGALQQTNMKRLMAYSSVAQVGYILVAFTAGGALGWEATLIYTFLYVFMNLGVFTILSVLGNSSHSEEITVFSGLSKRSFGLSLALIVFLLSLTGIPPLAGFVAKYTVFAAVIHNDTLLWLGIVAVLNSVVSLYYYFRVAQQAFFRDPENIDQPLQLSSPLLSCLVFAIGITLAAGILPNSLIGWVRNVLGS